MASSDSPSLLLRLIFGGPSSSSGSSENDALVIRKRLQITIVSAVAISSLATAAGIFGYQHVVRATRRHNLESNARSAALERKGKGKGKANDADSQKGQQTGLDGTDAVDSPKYLTSLPDSLPGPEAYRSSYGRNSRKAPKKWDEALLREQLARNYSFLGEEGMDKLRKASVTVVGAGGVGSWAALMLLRSGVGKIRIIDFDQVSLSSLNRHACATLADVGRPKVLCCADYFAKIAPWIEVEPIVDVFKAETAQELLSGDPTWIVDAIDNIDAKVLLLKTCYEMNVRVFACMGAGGKADPSRVQISDISDTYEDPLAASVRRRLRMQGIPPIPPKESPWLQTRNQGPKNAPKTSKQQPKEGMAFLNGHLSAEPESITRSSTMNTITPKDIQPAPIPERSSSVQTNGIHPEQQSSTSSRPGPSTLTPERRRRSFTHARRASSSSSIGSGVYSTPLSTPKLEADDQLQDDRAVPPLDDVAEWTEAGSESRHSEPDALADETLHPSSETADHEPSNPVNGELEKTDGELEEMEPASEAERLGTASDTEEDVIEHGTAFDAARATYRIPCVYSTEKSDVTLLPLPEEEYQRGQVNELSPLEQFRVRILPVLGPLPAIFGLAAATYIICDIAGHPMEPLAFRKKRKLYEKVCGAQALSRHHID